MRETTFTAAFTGQLSTIHGVSLPGTTLRVEQGHLYRLTLDEQTGKGQLEDLGLQDYEAMHLKAFARAALDKSTPIA